jgi:hypothetical protein
MGIYDLLQSRSADGEPHSISNGDGDWDRFVVNTTRDKRDLIVWTRATVIRDSSGDVKSTLQSDRDVSALAAAARDCDSIFAAIHTHLERVRGGVSDAEILGHLDAATRALNRAAELSRPLYR